MKESARYLNASEAAQRIGVTVKALRLYGERGLLTPIRTAAGWRAYGAHHMVRAAEVVGLRALGFSLAQAARVLTGDARGLEPALTAHQARLEAELRQLTAGVEKVRGLRGDIAPGQGADGRRTRSLDPAGRRADHCLRPSLAMGR